MPTRITMTISAVFLLGAGMACTFLPDALPDYMGLENAAPAPWIIQVIGGLYFGFGMLNWMARSTRIGGIYNRPIAIANFSHFFISGIALLKAFSRMEHLPIWLWGIAIFYVVFGLLFARILFSDPLKKITE